MKKGDFTMFKHYDNTIYICLFGRRYIFKDGAYIGWYRP